jgi:hypothetical protein
MGRTRLQNLTNNTYLTWTVVSQADNDAFGKTYWNCLCSCGQFQVIRGDYLKDKKRTPQCRTCTWTSPKINDLTGQKFGFYTALKKRGNQWLCECICGKKTYVFTANLTRNHSNSCGCKNPNLDFKNLTGKRFERWKVLSRFSKPGKSSNKGGYINWLCQCNCGTTRVVSSLGLLSGSSRSCGCLKKEVCSENGKRIKEWMPVRRGPEHPQWKGGSKISKHIRGLAIYQTWVKDVMSRDNWTCQHCDRRGGDLVAHHIIHFQKILDAYNIDSLTKAEFTPALWEIGNGITLCENCHKDLHSGLKILEKMRK